MKKHEFFTERFKLIRNELIEDIKHEMIKNNAREINLNVAIAHTYIDEQLSEDITSISIDERVFIDFGDTDVCSLQDLSNEQLILILQAIEEKEYEIEDIFID